MFKDIPAVRNIRSIISRIKREAEANVDHDIPGARPVCAHGIIVKDLKRGCCFCRGAIGR